MKLVFLGPPGAGKGTQAELVCGKYQIPHISTGDLLRSEMKAGTKLGAKAKDYIDQGLLVPDELVIEMLKERIAKPDCKVGYLLDGFPRTVPQAEVLEGMSETELAINIDVPNEKIIKRISGRRVCKDCGAVYHTSTHTSERCDSCGGELYLRDDDKPETVRTRLKVYEEQTKPLLAFYEKAGKLISVDSDRPVAEVFQDICQILDGKQK